MSMNWSPTLLVASLKSLQRTRPLTYLFRSALRKAHCPLQPFFHWASSTPPSGRPRPWRT
eukprot:10370024-Alexandrium_andersonii.AAC.1